LTQAERVDKVELMSRKRVFFFTSFVFALVLSGCASKWLPGEELLESPGYGGGETVCLDEDVAKNGLGSVLSSIPRPTDPRVETKADNMYPIPLYDICPPPSLPQTICTPDVSDYLLVATDVKVGQVILGRDRLITKQFSTADSPLPADYKDRLYRAFCGDWCYPSSFSEGYRGTFYCDFILYLKSDDASGGPLLGNPVDPQLPPDEAIFDIYFKKGAEIPEKTKCTDGQAALGMQAQDTDIPQFFINFNGFRWIFRGEGSVKKMDIMIEKPAGPRWLMGSTDIPELGGETFNMYVDLLFDALEEEEESIVYAIEKSEADKIEDPNVGNQERITYYEFQKVDEVAPRGRTLQLGTFHPPITAGWFKTWLTESKPAIYLYPEKELKINVRLNPAGRLTVTDPSYDPQKGWEVLALPSGLLRPTTHNSQPTTSYSYLYYEADLEKVFIGEEGFVVRGQDLVDFFGEILPKIGLNSWEIADFIKYWMGRLDRKQPYYFVHFLSQEQIEKLEPLELSVRPDTKIRMRAYFEPLEEPFEVKNQVLPAPPERHGFTLVEWGGILEEN
jgi:hypothetical protein